MIDGDGEIKWGPDPQLTPIGIEQAHTIQRAWMEEAATGLSPPHKRYCSPLSRALDTCDIMLNKVFSEHPHPMLILENFREENGVHTCDKRRTRSYISGYKPHFTIEERFEEYDQLWHPTIREMKAEVAQRAGKVLDRIFEMDTEHPFISITARAGFINEFLTAIGGGPVPLPTGGKSFFHCRD
ncbi:histidine phosphatase superfamily [Flammula alnicola]|nr:histidine phosphatase superfamily [Flammula alnicola]